MSPTAIDTLMSGIIALALVQGIVLIYFLLKKQTAHHIAHRMLAWLIFIAVINLIADMLYPFYDDNMDFLINLVLVGIGTALAAPPLIYLYTDLITRKESKNLRTVWWHFLPCALFLLVFVPLVLTADESIFQASKHDIKPISVWVVAITQLFFLFQFSVYLALSMLKLRRHNKTIENIFSATERINLNWLRNVLICLSLICVFMCVQTLLPWSDATVSHIGNFIILLVVALIYTLGYLGMKQTDIFGNEPELNSYASSFQTMANHASLHHTSLIHTTPDTTSNTVALFTEEDLLTHTQSIEDNHLSVSEDNQQLTIEQQTKNDAVDSPEKKDTQPLTEPSKEKYQNSALDKETSKLFYDELLKHMADHQPYLENGISLSGLAKQVKLSPNYLSQIINEQSQNNFFDFINRYRVTHFKTLLAKQLEENKTSNMIDMALASGFNSKSAFYSAFKKYEGMTPSQYRKSLQKL